MYVEKDKFMFIYIYELVCVCVCVCVIEAKFLQSCPTFCDPLDLAHQVPLSMGFSRQAS